jgi:hypothetical protein
LVFNFDLVMEKGVYHGGTLGIGFRSQPSHRLEAFSRRLLAARAIKKWAGAFFAQRP